MACCSGAICPACRLGEGWAPSVGERPEHRRPLSGGRGCATSVVLFASSTEDAWHAPHLSLIEGHY
jgi:hypothetical protein